MRKTALIFILFLSCIYFQKKIDEDYLYLLYQNYYNFSQFDKAEKALKLLISFYPKERYLEEYIRFLYLFKKYDDVINVYKKYKDKINFSKEITGYIMACALIEREEKVYDSLRNYFLSFIPLEEKDVEFLINMEILRKDKKKALEIIELFENYFKESENILRLKARILIENGKLNEGVEILENLKTKNEGDFVLMANTYQRLNDYDKSFFYFLKLDSLRKDDLEIKRNIIHILIQKNDFKKADSICDILLSYKGTDPEYLRLKGYLLYENNDLTGAMKNLLLSIEFNPDDDLSYYYMARIYYKLSQYDKALNYIKKAISINPNVPEYLSYKIFLMIIKKERKEVFYEIKNALKRYSDDPGINYLAGFFFSQTKDKKKAINFYKKSLKYDSLNSNKWFELGMIYESLNMVENAEKCFEKVIKIDSLNASAYNYWGYMLAERGIKLELAMKLIEKALQIEPNNGYYLDSMGWVYYKMGEYEKAKDYLYNALQVLDSDPVIFEHYGDVLMKLGDVNRAKEFYKKALKFDPKNKNLLKKVGE
ncbi:MAG: tetratricopeptide repeat protein [candidate division WOR-3 bacterium]